MHPEGGKKSIGICKESIRTSVSYLLSETRRKKLLLIFNKCTVTAALHL
jgi:hypothetical protein